MNANRISSLVIVGGGTAGWIAAAAIAKSLKNQLCNITLIESPNIGTVGVGEATIPPMVSFLQFLEVNEKEFMQETQASFKLAIKFEDWHKPGESFFHPFGSIGVNIDGNEFYPCWLKAKANGEQAKYADFSPAAVMSAKNKFYPPHRASKDSFLAGAGYAYHFDAGLVAKFLRRYSEKLGVTRIESNVVNVNKNEQEFLQSVELDSGQVIEGDFFIDCSGFKGLLIEEALTTGYEDWSDLLPCNRAVAMQTENVGEIDPYTTSTARDFGWSWKVPLQHRTGNGYVFCSEYCSDDEAVAKIHSITKGKPLTEPRVIPFVTGRRKKIWNKNCLALGLSAGFLEPLESTAIHLVTRGVRAFLDLFPDKTYNQNLENEYNRILLGEYETIKDFIVLHYCTTKRDDNPFWQRCQNIAVPESLKRKIDLFVSRGVLEYNPGDLFKPPSWFSIYEGMGVVPNNYDPFVDSVNTAQLKSVISQVKSLMLQMADSLPPHAEYLQKYCPAKGEQDS